MPEVEFVVFEPADCRMAGWFSGLPNIQTRPTPIPSEGRWRKLFYSSSFWGKELRQETFDIFEGFHLPFPKVHSRNSILTVHDLRCPYPDWGSLNRIVYRLVLSRSISNADMVLAVSESMKQELLPYCGQAQVCVIPNGLDAVSTDFQPKPVELEAFRSKFALPDRFLLAVGHLERRKNYPKLIEALAHLHISGCASHLLIVGNESGERQALEAHIAANGLKGSVTLASGLSDMEVRCAYALCELFVFPSTYEGFGIPILEAMAAGKPMVLSDIPVFREITESRSVYFAPDDAKDMALTIERLLKSTSRIDSCIAYGFERVASFDYSRITALYMDLYSQLLDN